MAVKKHALVGNSGNPLEFATLIQYITMMTNQPGLLPPAAELIKQCQDIVKCLARVEMSDTEEVWQQLSAVEEFFVVLVNTAHGSLRQDIVLAVLEKFYAFTSDPQSGASPAVSVALTVVDLRAPQPMLSAARWVLQHGEHGPAGEGLRAALACMYRWVAGRRGSQALPLFLLAFINVLETTDNTEMLISVTLASMEPLFLALALPGLQQAAADVVFHALAALRQCTEALDRISPHVGRILDALAAASGQWSRHMLQSAVDIVTAMAEHQRDHAPRTLAAARTRERVAVCLERHMSSRSCRFLMVPAWVPPLPPPAPARPVHRKLGLVNMGNTCYMNSIVQALLVTKHHHVVRNMSLAPYWSVLGALFARLLHSAARQVHPADFFRLMKPPFFTLDQQHDSYEYLGYLLELLQSHEHIVDPDFDYARAAGSARLRPVHQAASAAEAESGGASAVPATPARRSVSPRPGGSGASESTASASKRASSEEPGLPRKRLRISDTSFIDNIFGGVLLTRLECSHCHLSSLSRDVFRDIQLAFPEKPEPGQQQSVQGLLEYFCSKERLYGQNRYECPDCGGLRDAERSVLVETPPKYLVLVMKHFRFDPKKQTQSKLMHSVHYNHSITLPTARAREHRTYHLYAAVVHLGCTLDSGHYYTLAEDRGHWHVFNDDRVTVTRDDEVNELKNSSTPYILFYRRTDLDECSSPSFEDMPPNMQDCVTSHNKLVMLEP